jgi:F-type H+-transporting ATPase subunit b
LDALGKLGINAGLLIANVINLVLMIAVLSAVAYKPIKNMMLARRERLAQGLNNARRAEEALASAEADKQAILDEARAEAQQIVADARSRADEAAAQVKAEAQEEARRLREKAEQDAGSEKELALADMRDQIVSLSLAAAGHLLGSEIDAKKAKASVAEFFTSVPADIKGLGAATVVTAVPLTEAEKKKYTKALDAEDVEFVTDTGILGGVIVRAGAQEVDASYANQLAQMRASLV